MLERAPLSPWLKSLSFILETNSKQNKGGDLGKLISEEERRLKGMRVGISKKEGSKPYSNPVLDDNGLN